MSMDIASIGWIDWLFLAVVGLSIVVGIVRGLLYEVMSLLGWVVAYVAAQAVGATVAPSLPIGAPGSGPNLAAAFIVVFVAVLIGWSFITWLLKQLIQASPLKPLDRGLGAVFGLLRGVLVALVAVTAVTLTPLAASPAWQAAHSVAAMQAVLAGIRPWLPADVARHLRA